MMRSIFDPRLGLLAAGLLLCASGTGCRQQGGPGPARYEREISSAASNGTGKAETYHPGPPDRYPWQGRNTNRIDGLSDRIAGFETQFRQESETHSQVIHGRRKQP
ncbi:MAG TPA: hypothetical protein VIV61_15735 [Candidatus Ozemobacteraceae bacterium]